MQEQSTGAQGVSASYRVAPFRPDGGFDASGIGVLMGVLMATAMLLGVVCHFVGQIFWVVFIFPLGVGFLLGAVGERAVCFARLRNPVLGGLAGLLGGIVAMTVMHYGHYLQFRSDIDIRLQQASREFKLVITMPENRLREAIRDEPVERQQNIMETWRVMHVDSFAAFMESSARDGISISHHGSKAINLGYVGTWIYWTVEVLVVAGVTYLMVKAATSAPYCVACDQWKTSRPLGSFACAPPAAKSALESGSMLELSQRNPSPAVVTTRGLAVTLAECPRCAGRGAMDVKLEQLTDAGKGKITRKTLAHVTYPAQAKTDLATLFAPPAPSPARRSSPAPAIVTTGLARLASIGGSSGVPSES